MLYQPTTGTLIITMHVKWRNGPRCRILSACKIPLLLAVAALHRAFPSRLHAGVFLLPFVTATATCMHIYCRVNRHFFSTCKLQTACFQGVHERLRRLLTFQGLGLQTAHVTHVTDVTGWQQMLPRATFAML